MKMSSLLCVVLFTSLTTVACNNGAKFSAGGSKVSAKDHAADGDSSMTDDDDKLGNGSTVPEQGDFGDDSSSNPGTGGNNPDGSNPNGGSNPTGSGSNPNGSGSNPAGGNSNGGSTPSNGSTPDGTDDSSSDYPTTGTNPNNCVWDDSKNQCVPGTQIPGQSGSGYNPGQNGNQNQNKTGSKVK